MEYRQLGTSGVQASAVAFGAWAIGGWMWGGADEADAIAAIHRAIDVGMTTIDTAPMYGFGRSEEIVGKAISGRRDKVQILTKYCLRWDSEEGEYYFDTTDAEGRPWKIYSNARPESVILECERSLRRLGTDHIDLYQCHRRDGTTPVEDTMGAVAKLIAQGKIIAAGVSNFTVEEIRAAAGVVPIASNQPPYSMVNRGIEADLLPYCRKNNIASLVYSPLQLGLLTGKITSERTFNEGDLRNGNRFFKSDVIGRVNAFLDEIRPIAESHGATLAQLVINWTIHRPGVTVALVGARNADQVAENAKAADFTLSEDETRRIDTLLDDLDLPDA